MLVECGTQFIGRKLSEMNQEKLSSIKVNILYKRAGNVIVQQEVEFEIYAVGDHFFAVTPFISRWAAACQPPARTGFFCER